MLMFSEQFSEQKSDEIIYNGKVINRFFRFEQKGTHLLRFSFVNSTSKYTQAIIFHLISFDGKIFYNDKEIEKPKKSFPQIVFSEKSSPNIFELKITLNSGSLYICNGSDLLGNEKTWASLYGGCAMIVENKQKNSYRFYCNDHENDDDFNDLIFDLEIIKTGDGSVS